MIFLGHQSVERASSSHPQGMVGWLLNTSQPLNPLAPNSDQLLISRNNITPESNIKVRRIKEMITNL